LIFSAAAISAFVGLICRLRGLNPWLYSPVELRERGYPLDGEIASPVIVTEDQPPSPSANG
jgi:hypothetical protein